MAKKMWMYSPSKRAKNKPSETDKKQVSDFFQSLIDEFKANIEPPKNKDWNYITDIYTKWYRNYFYICEKWKSESENRLKDEWESNVVRLEFIKNNEFDFSYFRHTGKWHLVSIGITLEECKQMIMGNPNFQPLL